MTILSALDQPNYFPNVSASGAALDGLIQLAQVMCEGSYGANRPLERQPHTEIITINSIDCFGYLSRFPVVSVEGVQVRSRRRGRLDGWGRSTSFEWYTLAPADYQLDFETGQLNLFGVFNTEAKVSYVSGFDFANPNPQAKQIKAIAGLVLTYMANNRPGLNSYLNNPATGTAESFNYESLDNYLGTLLSPLKKYIPRRSGG
ncbi:MAG: hypothetical protein HC881_18590 [Leptolyngbyaceae cyanobacterium SL_7_1]|nr:hypothetical protein [Leptolyngbyaceae cyanobacterium SL_7_1]